MFHCRHENDPLLFDRNDHAGIERRDRRVAASIQFQRGDAVTFKIDDKEMEGEIAGLNVSLGCHLVSMYSIVHELYKHWNNLLKLFFYIA